MDATVAVVERKQRVVKNRRQVAQAHPVKVIERGRPHFEVAIPELAELVLLVDQREKEE